MEKIWLKSWPRGTPQQLEFPEKPLHEFLRDNGKRHPDKVAVNYYGRRMSLSGKVRPNPVMPIFSRPYLFCKVAATPDLGFYECGEDS